MSKKRGKKVIKPKLFRSGVWQDQTVIENISDKIHIENEDENDPFTIINEDEIDVDEEDSPIDNSIDDDVRYSQKYGMYDYY